MTIFNSIGNHRIILLGEEIFFFLSYKLGAEEVSLAFGGCPETSAGCGKPDMAPKESSEIHGELLEIYN